MPVIRNIDIRGIDWPVCILSCKRQIDDLKPGESIRITMDDKDVMKTLVDLLKRLSGFSIEKKEATRPCRLIIKKEDIWT